MADDYGWLRRLLKDLGDRVYKLEHPKLKPVRQTLLWSFYGAIEEMTPESGNYPVFDTGNIFELWISTLSPASADIVVALIARAEEDSTGYTIGYITLPAGQLVNRAEVQIPVTSGQRISIQATPQGGGTPANEITVAARAS